jgi:hypothetical protein
MRQFAILFEGQVPTGQLLSVKVFVVLTVPLKALTVTVYVPAGCASVTLTTPVKGSAANVPLKFVEVWTLMEVALVGAESGVMVVSLPKLTVVFG